MGRFLLPEVTSFVYRWTDHKTQKLYLGYHKGTIDDGYVCSSKLMMEQYLLRPQDFSREIIAEGTLDDMRKLESKMLSDVDARTNVSYYNQTNGNENFYLKGHTKETRLKMSNKVRSEDHSRKISEGHKGKIVSEETKRKMSAARRGKITSLETRRKISMALRGRKPPADRIQKMRETKMGSTLSKEHKQRISDAGKGKKHSEDSKRKMSESRKLYWMKRKNNG